MSQINLSIATNDYDHFRDVRIRKLNQGLTLTGLFSPTTSVSPGLLLIESSIFQSCHSPSSGPDHTRQTGHHRFTNCLLETFPFSSFYINKNSGIKTVEDLKGKRVGRPNGYSAAVWMRGGCRMIKASSSPISTGSKLAQTPRARREGRTESTRGHKPGTD